MMSSPKSTSRSPTKNMSRAKSDYTNHRKVTMKTQGGGFNRTTASGYFKGKSGITNNK